MLKRSLFFIFSIITINTSCGNEKIIDNNKTTNKIIVGAERINEYKSLITAKKIGIVANHTSVIFKSSNKSKSKLLGNEYYSSGKLEMLGFKAKKSLINMNETDF